MSSKYLLEVLFCELLPECPLLRILKFLQYRHLFELDWMLTAKKTKVKEKFKKICCIKQKLPNNNNGHRLQTFSSILPCQSHSPHPFYTKNIFFYSF